MKIHSNIIGIQHIVQLLCSLQVQESWWWWGEEDAVIVHDLCFWNVLKFQLNLEHNQRPDY